jgi:hypothetical protein
LEASAPLLINPRSSGQELSEDADDLNSTVGDLDLMDLYGTVHAATAGHAFLPSWKRHLKTFRIMESTPSALR